MEKYIANAFLPRVQNDYRGRMADALSSPAAFKPRGRTSETYDRTVEKGRPVLQVSLTCIFKTAKSRKRPIFYSVETALGLSWQVDSRFSLRGRVEKGRPDLPLRPPAHTTEANLHPPRIEAKPCFFAAGGPRGGIAGAGGSCVGAGASDVCRAAGRGRANDAGATARALPGGLHRGKGSFRIMGVGFCTFQGFEVLRV